jgi:hypothetical protein
MAYFSNGTEGFEYKKRFCFRCINWREDENGWGCPIWDVHILYSYELCNSKSKAKEMLDFLIPMDKEHNPKECRMFMEGKK